LFCQKNKVKIRLTTGNSHDQEQNKNCVDTFGVSKGRYG